MTAQSAVQEFAAALQDLRETAGSPTYAELVRQAAGQRPPLKLNVKSLSDWFTGTSVPDNPAAVRFLVAYLGPRATRSGYSTQPIEWWVRIRERAWQERHANRGGRPESRNLSQVARQSRLGRPVGECDPLALEVHPAIDLPGQDDEFPNLTTYVPRTHDARLREVAKRVIDGVSRLVTLVGGSSTGKTRACWELAQYLDKQQPDRWRLWHPYDPTRPEAAAAAIDQAGQHTIVWLNEAHFYLAPANVRLAEQIAAGLRTLLQDPRRGPVLILATLWPDYWSALTTRPPASRRDPYAQARDLLTGTAITVPDTFTPSELAGLARTGVDLRLRQAAAHAEGGRITQYLAGAPELENRYRMASPAAKAIIRVAMDARRLGHPLALPHSLLDQAAPGYLSDHDWDSLGEDWLEQALAYTAQPCKGARGPLTRIRPRPAASPNGNQPHYRLADYLEQTGRTDRSTLYPPETLWTAFTTSVDDPELLKQLGLQAEQRGRFQHAVSLYARAADRGDTEALRMLAERRERAGDATGAEALAIRAANRGDTDALRILAERRERTGDAAGAEALAIQVADRGDTDVLRALAERRERSGDPEGAKALYRRAGDRGDPVALRALARLQERAGDHEGAEVLYQQAADHGDTSALWALAERLEEKGDAAAAEALAVQAADRGATGALRTLAERREWRGDGAGAAALAVQAADRGDTSALRALADRREKKGNAASAELLYRQAVSRGDTDALWALARLRDRAGDSAGAEALALRAADQGDTGELSALALRRERAGDGAGAEALYRQAADRGDTDALWALARLRERAGDPDGAEVLYREAADRGDTNALRVLAERREWTGDVASAEVLYREAADRGDTSALRVLAERRQRAGDTASAEVLYREAADRGDTGALATLAERLEESGDRSGAQALAVQAADWGATGALRTLAERREWRGDTAGAEALAVQAADHGDTAGLWALAERREEKGNAADAEVLYRQAADRGDTDALRALARRRERVGDAAGAEALYRQAVDRGDTGALWALAERWERAGDSAAAGLLRCFGLTEAGEIATELDFGSFGGIVFQQRDNA